MDSCSIPAIISRLYFNLKSENPFSKQMNTFGWNLEYILESLFVKILQWNFYAHDKKFLDCFENNPSVLKNTVHSWKRKLPKTWRTQKYEHKLLRFSESFTFFALFPHLIKIWQFNVFILNWPDLHFGKKLNCQRIWLQ